MEFILRVLDDGRLAVSKAIPGTTNYRPDPTFEPALMELDDRLDLHVNTENVDPFGVHEPGVRRMITLSLFDDAIPQFSSQHEADLWLEARASR